MSNKLNIAFFLLVAASVAVGGEPVVVRKYTLEECVRIGLERSATALNAVRDKDIARATVTEARSRIFPQLAVDGAYTRLDELQSMDIGGASLEMGTLDNYAVNFKATQTLYSGGQLSASIEAAKVANVYADWELADVEAGLIRNIRTSFYDILLAKSAVGVKEESVKQIQALVEQTEQKFKNGRASEFDVLSARVRLANEKPELIRVRNMHQLAIAAFKRLINVDDDGFDVDGVLECQPVTGTLDAFCRPALLNRPVLKLMEAAVALREQDVQVARSAYYPSVNCYFLYSGANSYQFVSFGNDLQWRWSAGVSANWSLWDSGLTRSIVKGKRLELEKTKTTLEDNRKAVVLEIKQAYLDMEMARETIEAGRGNVEMAERALTISKSRFDSGLATYLEFADSNHALREAQLSLSVATRDYMTAVARLHYAAGIDRIANQQAGEEK